MLRRNPTALTITPSDIQAFEESHLRRLAYIRYLKTGEDPEGLFRDGSGPEVPSQQRQSAQEGEQGQVSGAGGQVDPNDELKPLPGDKARIVRGREERIMGTAGR
jgi:hypothetical protein